MQIENKKRQISQKEEQIEKNESIISDEEAEEIDRLRQQNSGRNRQADRLHSEVSKIYSSMHSLAHNQMSHSAKELEHDLESEGLIIHSPTKKALSGFNKIGVIERIRDEMRKHQTNETEHIQNIITDLRMVEQLIIEFRNEFPANLRIIANRTDNQIIKQDIETLEVAYKQLARDAEQIDKLAREYIVLFER